MRYCRPDRSPSVSQMGARFAILRAHDSFVGAHARFARATDDFGSAREVVIRTHVAEMLARAIFMEECVAGGRDRSICDRDTRR
jgi:hypothetical protein